MNKLTDLQKAQIASLVRLVLALCGGWLAKKGIDVDVMAWTDIAIAGIGAGQVLLALVWSFRNKAAVAPAVAVAKQVQEGTALIGNTEFATKADVEKTQAHVATIVAAAPGAIPPVKTNP